MSKKNVIRTSKKQASNASKLLSSKDATKKVKGIAGSDLVNRKRKTK